jgi:hypothetical protein
VDLMVEVEKFGWKSVSIPFACFQFLHIFGISPLQELVLFFPRYDAILIDDHDFYSPSLIKLLLL